MEAVSASRLRYQLEWAAAILGITGGRKPKAQLINELGFWFGKGLGDDLLSHGYDRTIIGATSFHGPVRDGKGWFQRAMVAKNSGVVRSGILPW